MYGSTPVVDRIPASAAGAGIRVLVASTAFLVLALIKPWGSSFPAPHPSAVAGVPVGFGASHTQPIPSETGTTPSAGPGQIVCAPAGWQIVTLDRLADWTVRTWIPAAPVAAGSPLDPTIPTIRLGSTEVLSVGVCGSNDPSATVSADAALAMAVVAAWDTHGGQLRLLDVATAQSAGLDTRLARLYAPTAGDTTPATWPMGHFVLELAPLAGEAAALDAGGSEPRWYVGIAIPGLGPRD